MELARTLSGVPEALRPRVAALLAQLEADPTELHIECASIILGLEQMLMLAKIWHQFDKSERSR